MMALKNSKKVQMTGQLEIQAEVVLCFMQLVLTFYYFVLVDIITNMLMY